MTAIDEWRALSPEERDLPLSGLEEGLNQMRLGVAFSESLANEEEAQAFRLAARTIEIAQRVLREAAEAAEEVG
jgi:hypothetical protein